VTEVVTIVSVCAASGFLRIHPHTPTLVSIVHLSATSPLILSIPACQYKTVRTNSSHAWSQFAIVLHLPVRNTDKQRLLDKQARADTKSEFTRMASAIGKDISSTTAKLGKLAQCVLPYPLFHVAEPLTALASVAKRKTLFDDRPVEISVRGTCLAFPVMILTSHLISGTNIRHQARHCKY
jgi:hypothetical protein